MSYLIFLYFDELKNNGDFLILICNNEFLFEFCVFIFENGIVVIVYDMGIIEF